MAKRRGRPEIVYDWDTIDKLCALHCTQEEIAAIIKSKVETINLHTKKLFGKTFGEYWSEKALAGKMSLRRKQYECAMNGNITMLIFLGKNWLDQADKMEQRINGQVTHEHNSEKLKFMHEKLKFLLTEAMNERKPIVIGNRVDNRDNFEGVGEATTGGGGHGEVEKKRF